MSNKVKLKMKRVKLEYDFKKAEFEEVSDVRKENIDKFQNDFELELEYINRNAPEVADPKEGEEVDIKDIKPKKLCEEGMKSLKAIYRLIANLTHPDKTGDESLVEEFHKASEYHKTKNLPEMIELASDLNIDISGVLLDHEVLYNQLENEIGEISDKVSKIRQSISWAWSQVDSEEEKESLKKMIYKFWGITPDEVHNYSESKKGDQ
jgi:hypothetical protein